MRSLCSIRLSGSMPVSLSIDLLMYQSIYHLLGGSQAMPLGLQHSPSSKLTTMILLPFRLSARGHVTGSVCVSWLILAYLCLLSSYQIDSDCMSAQAPFLSIFFAVVGPLHRIVFSISLKTWSLLTFPSRFDGD